MGVLNLTPDSFSDGGLFLAPTAALDRASQLIEEGADILDLGAESTRPGAAPVDPEVEFERLAPLIDALGSQPIALSVDTRNVGTMRRVLAMGVDMINDVRALSDPGALEALANSAAGACLMHMQGDPLTMQRAPAYRSVVGEISAFLHDRVNRAMQAGVPADRLLVDPGIGFGKTLEHNLALVREVATIEAVCGRPVLVGLSRKSMLGALTGRAVHERLAASLGGALAAVLHGAKVLRVHDVAATRDALEVFERIRHAARGGGTPRSEQGNQHGDGA